MESLKIQLDKIITFIEDKSDVIFIDYPAHHNVGDLLIYQGALELFKKHGVTVKAFRSVVDYSYEDIKKYVNPQTTILCHGGGNFGDIYPIHQVLREKVVENFPENRIIVLPQTAHFSSESSFQQTREKLKKHSNLILFARDARTLELFKAITAKAYLSPDMAHSLYGLYPKSVTKIPSTLYFLRLDKEVNEKQASLVLPDGVISKDWVDFISSKDRAFRRFINYMYDLSKNTNSRFIRDLTAKFWIWHCEYVVKRSFKFFSKYNEIITSRMHGHILACLVDVPNKIIDNSYGKNTGYYNEWTKPVLCASLIDDEKE
ncbi:polysaccharide pyruvyl transferase family protein [Pluralibacter gergoviae]|nr:polysaccharide pyruvyl transferase family protein [Pluralibacter gergoviae]MBK4118573.1 polysaccharide pyruvyl transferase family protein [Pluralibacter gergoviae]